MFQKGTFSGLSLLTYSENLNNMGSKLSLSNGPDKPDGIERISNALFTGLMGIVLLCALLPVFISQIGGLSDNPILTVWDGLGSFQTLAYLLPVVFLIGLFIVIIRFFSNRD